MAITASRIGKSPLTLNWSNLLVSDRLFNSDESLNLDPSHFSEVWQSLRNRFDTGEVGFFDCPTQNELSQLSETKALAKSLMMGGFTDCLFLGIGGSSLGPRSLLSALRARVRSPLRFHFQENPDPIDWIYTLSNLDPEKTLVLAVTKSGGTFETLAQLRLALEWLGKNRWNSHLVAITDPKKGEIRQFCEEEGIRSLNIAPSIGGRFSIFCPVGLLAAELSGINSDEFLAGAKQVTDYVLEVDPAKNSLFLLASELIKNFKQRPIHVFMPYSTCLREVGDWFVQLWSESLGKNKKGFTPISAVGATDQHSILQLLKEGPDDKVTFFVTVDRVEDPVTIPKSSSEFRKDIPTFRLLAGNSFSNLLEIEYQATCKVLTGQKRPNLTFQLETVNERNLGSLYMALSVLTAFCGHLWKINPFDQPGVEEGKNYIRESLNQFRMTREPDRLSDVERLRPADL